MYRKFIPPFLSLLIVACAGLQQPTAEVRVPDKLKPQSNESLAMIVRAKGVQVYECRAKKDQVGGYEWAFVAPEADLFDVSGTGSADTMRARVGNRLMAARSWAR